MLEDFIRSNPTATVADYNSRPDRFVASSLSTSALLAEGVAGLRVLSFMELVAGGADEVALAMKHRLRALEAGTVRLDSPLTRDLLSSLVSTPHPADGEPVASQQLVENLLAYSPDQGGATQDEWDQATTKITRQNVAAAWREQVRVWSNAAVDAYVASGSPLPQLS